MKRTIKTYFKLFIFLFGISILLWNCKDEVDFQLKSEQVDEVQQTASTSYRVTSLENIPELQTVVQNIKKIEPSKHLELSRDFSFLNDIENLNTDEIIEYTNETGYTTFSFKFNTTETSIDFENLHLLETENGGYIAYILSYQPNEDWYNEHLNADGSLNFDITTYQGEITKYSLEREVIWSTNLETTSRGESSTQSRGYFYTICVIAQVTPYCGCNIHEPNNLSGCECIVSQEEACQTLWGGGGYIGSDNDPSDPDGSNGNGTAPTCNNTTGTGITPDDEPIDGVTNDCTPNNNNGVADSSATYDAFWQGLSYNQQNFLNQNSLIKNDVLYYLDQNQYAIQNQLIANNLIDFLAIPFPTTLSTTNEYKAEMLRMTIHLKQFGNPEDHNFANYVESLFPYLNSMTIGENSDLAYLTYQQTQLLTKKYLRSIVVPFAEAAYPFVVFAIVDATLGAAIPILSRIPLSMVLRGERLNKMVREVAKLGVQGNQPHVRIITTSNPVGKAEKLFTTLTKDKIGGLVEVAPNVFQANMGSGNYIIYRTVSSSGFPATINLNFPSIFGVTPKAIKFI